MRHFLPVVLAILSAFIVSACQGSSTATDAASSTAAQPTSVVVDFETINKLAGFIVGTGKSVMSLPDAYVLFDPQCPHCAHLWDAAVPLQAVSKIKWIPIGMFNGVSTTQSAMLLEATDPITMMRRNEATLLRTGHPSSATAPFKDETRKLVEENTAMLATLKSTSVPTIVYRSRNSRSLSIAYGAHSTEKLAALLGVKVPPKSSAAK